MYCIFSKNVISEGESTTFPWEDFPQSRGRILDVLEYNQRFQIRDKRPSLPQAFRRLCSFIKLCIYSLHRFAHSLFPLLLLKVGAKARLSLSFIGVIVFHYVFIESTCDGKYCCCLTIWSTSKLCIYLTVPLCKWSLLTG